MPPEPQQQHTLVTPQGSTTPLISSQQREAAESNAEADGGADERDPKTGKRRFFGLGKKKEEKNDMATSTTGSTLLPSQASMRPPSPGKAASELKPQPGQTQPVPISPSRNPYSSTSAAIAPSPSRLRSSSPRLHSPASSEIFERSVQEPVQISTLQEEHTEAHMATHVITEDHIPPALEASAQAITSENLNADEVEIVMSTSHQPAGSVLETSASHADLSQLNSPMSPLHQATSHGSEPSSSLHQSGIVPTIGEEDGASNYGQLDPNDVRRLSFISFADVVQSEHQQPPGSALSDVGNRDSLHIASLPSSFKAEGRAPSPLRTPRSPTSMQSRTLSGGVTTPPAGVNSDPTGLEQSPGEVGGPISPPSELTIQTMRQAVRRTASGDLTGRNAGGMSPVSDEALSAPRSRTNS